MITPEALSTRLEALVGSARVWTEPAQTSAYAIEAHRPALVVQPETLAQAVAILQLAERDRLAVVPWGQGTQMHLGGIPQRYDLALSLAGLSRIVEYDVANLTLIAEAGVPLRQVYRASIPERQFLPLGFPGTMASLGGLVVTNVSGVKRARYGSLRDLLLGVKVALPEGALVRYGGRVVKNVAGYDMNKLFIGSLGAFGVVLETSYRLAALPEDDRLLAVVFPTLAQGLAAAAAVQESQLQPSAITFLSPVAAATTNLPWAIQGHEVVLLLNFDGVHEAVERQMRDSQTSCQQHGGLDAALVEGEALLSLWDSQEQRRMAPDTAAPVRLQLRLGVLRQHLAAAIDTLTTPQSFCQQGVSWHADYVYGQIFVHLPLHQPEAEDVGNAVCHWLTQLRTQLHEWQGYAVIEYAPAALRQQLDIWGATPGAQLLRLYKDRFDPHAILNPGRYVAGL